MTATAAPSTPLALVVEDEATNAQLVRSALEHRGGCEVVICPDGASAALELARRSLDIVLTDIELPDSSGLELAARSKTLDAAVPLVVMTGHERFEYALEAACLLLDGDGPAALALLRETVKRLRRERRTPELVTALVYLAEAEWRAGCEDAADRAADDAYALAMSDGSHRRLVRSLADFPGVLSRRIDAEPAADDAWRSIGRALSLLPGAAGPAAPRSPLAELTEFGEPCLVVDGVRVKPKIRKSLELLSFLLSRPGRTARRDEVLTALWNGRDDDATRAYLRQALRHLREVFPAGITVGYERGILSLEGPVTSERTAFDALLLEAGREPGSRRLDLLFEALSIASRGRFLEGSNGVWWVDESRDLIDSRRADAMLDAAELTLDGERYNEAIALTREALDHDPLLERGWRLLMRARGMLGDGDGVTSAYRRCRSALAEVALEPSRPTIDLARALRA